MVGLKTQTVNRATKTNKQSSAKGTDPVMGALKDVLAASKTRGQARADREDQSEKEPMESMANEKNKTIIESVLQNDVTGLSQMVNDKVRERIMEALLSEDEEDESDEGEEEEQLDELSNKVLKSYISKAYDSGALAAHELGKARERGDDVDRFGNRVGWKKGVDQYKVRDQMKDWVGGDNKTISAGIEKVGKRGRGIQKALGKLK